MVYVEVAHVDVESVSEKFDLEPFGGIAHPWVLTVGQKLVGLKLVSYAEVPRFGEEKIGELVSTLFFVIQR